MGDKSITKVSSASAPQGTKGQKYLAAGVHLSMRLWKGKNPVNRSQSRHGTTKQQASCSTARPSYNSKVKRYCWRKAIRGLFPKVRSTLTKFWKPSPQSKPPARLQKCTTATPDQLLSPEERGITLLQRFNLSYFYPFEALDNVILAFGAWLFLRENVTRELWLGMILICCGTMLVTAT